MGLVSPCGPEMVTITVDYVAECDATVIAMLNVALLYQSLDAIKKNHC